MPKVCTKCGEEKDESGFGKDRHARDGLTHQCRTCRSENSRAWDRNNRERTRLNQKEWRDNNKDKVHEYNKRQYWKDPERSREEARRRAREWAENNPEEYKERNKRIYEERKAREGLGDRDKHRMSRTPTYNSWNSMRRRCTEPTYWAYYLYGGRGISVCDRWMEDFLNFLEDMGERPSKEYSLDRIDVNGNYEPGNCRWATKEEQYRNRRNTNWITYNGETKTIKEWASQIGIRQKTLQGRVDAGMTDEEIVTGVRGEIIYPEKQFTEEEWKRTDFRGFGNKALVSSNGRLYIDTRGLGPRNIKPRCTHGDFVRNGYRMVRVLVDGILYTANVHQLVATAFIDPHGYDKGLIVHHIDGNRENNHVNNLCFCSAKHNLMLEQSERYLSSGSDHSASITSESSD